MGDDSSTSEDESLAAYAAVAVSGEAVKADAVKSGAKAAKRRCTDADGRPENGAANNKLGRVENKLWEALEKRLDRDLADGTPACSKGKTRRKVDSGGSRDDQGASGDGEVDGEHQGNAQRQQATAQLPAAGFQLFGSTKRKRRLADAAERPASTAVSSQQAAPSERTANGGAVEPRLIAALADPEAGRQRTHEELVQLMGNDAPRAPNRKKRRVELQGPKMLRRQKNLERIAKATGEAKAALIEGLSDKARAKLTKKQLRHERAKAKLEKRRRMKAAKAAEERWRARKGLPRKDAGEQGGGGSGKGKRKKGAVKRGKFSTRRAHGVANEKNKAKYNRRKDAAKANKAAAQ